MPYTKDTIIRRARKAYEQGARTADLAIKFKTPVATLSAWLREDGMQFRPVGADRRRKVSAEEIVRRYLAGEGVLNLACHYSVSRPVILRRLLEANVTLRTPSQQAFISQSKATPEQRRERARAANAACRGSKRAEAVVCRDAIRRQHLARETAKEHEWRMHFLRHGIIMVPQYAVGRYSVDLAIPDARIAVEVKSGWSFSGAKKLKEQAKEKALKSLGWLVIGLSGTRWTDAWVDRVRPYVDERRKLMLRAP